MRALRREIDPDPAVVGKYLPRFAHGLYRALVEKKALGAESGIASPVGASLCTSAVRRSGGIIAVDSNIVGHGMNTGRNRTSREKYCKGRWNISHTVAEIPGGVPSRVADRLALVTTSIASTAKYRTAQPALFPFFWLS